MQPVTSAHVNPPTIPDHTLLRPIGRGAYGEVWLARNVMGALRAVKLVWRRQFESQRPYEREFAGIQHFEPVSRSSSGLVHVLHVGRNDAEGYFYYVMELADAANASDAGSEASSEAITPHPHVTPDTGTLDTYCPRTLRSDLNPAGRLPTADCIRVALDVVGGLAQLHRHGLVHRDVKPGNIIYVNGRAKLADIGLLSAGGEGRTFVGTEGYIPPEGPGTPSADLYALGIAVYEASTGNPPERFPDVPPEWLTHDEGNEALEFHEIILKACEGQRERRYESAEAMRADLALLQSGQSVRRVRALERRYTHLRLSGIIGTIMLVCALMAAFFANYRARLATENRAKETRLREQAQDSLARAEAAEHETQQQLYTALLGEARATVRSAELGHRVRALEALRLAATISNRVELRREVFAALALPDLRFERELAIGPNVTQAQCDPAFERVALCRGTAPVEIRSLADGALIASLPASVGLPSYVALWSPNGRYLALKRDRPPGGRRADWEVWEVSLVQRKLLLNDLLGEPISFHPQLNQLSAARSGTVTRWNLENGEEISRVPLAREPRRLELSPDGERFAVVHEEAAGHVVSLCDATNGKVMVSWTFPDFVGDLRWHPGGKWIAVADHSGKVQLLDCLTSEVKVLGHHKVEATTLAFSPAGDYLISGGWEKELICWDLRTLTLAFTIGINSYHLQFSSDGRRCATIVRSSTPQRFFQEFKLHTFERPTAIREFHEDLGSRLDQATFSSDGRWLAASGSKHVGVWDLAADGPGALTGLDSTARLFFTPDASELLGSSRLGKWMRWRITPGIRFSSANPAPELQPVALANPAGFNSVCLASNLIVWTCSRGSRIGAPIQPERETVWMPTASGLSAASPDARWLGVYRSFGNLLSIYRLATLEPVATLTNRSSIYNFQFSPKGDEVAIASRSGIEFWSTSTWRRTREISGFINILYAPDACTLWLTEDYRSAGLYDAATLELLLPLPTGMLPLVLDPDGRRLVVSVDLRRLQVWDLPKVRSQLALLELDWRE